MRGGNIFDFGILMQGMIGHPLHLFFALNHLLEQRDFARHTWADTPVRYHATAGITMIELDK